MQSSQKRKAKSSGNKKKKKKKLLAMRAYLSGGSLRTWRSARSSMTLRSPRSFSLPSFSILRSVSFVSIHRFGEEDDDDDDDFMSGTFEPPREPTVDRPTSPPPRVARLRVALPLLLLLP